MLTQTSKLADPRPSDAPPAGHSQRRNYLDAAHLSTHSLDPIPELGPRGKGRPRGTPSTAHYMVPAPYCSVHSAPACLPPGTLFAAASCVSLLPDGTHDSTRSPAQTHPAQGNDRVLVDEGEKKHRDLAGTNLLPPHTDVSHTKASQRWRKAQAGDVWGTVWRAWGTCSHARYVHPP